MQIYLHVSYRSTSTSEITFISRDILGYYPYPIPYPIPLPVYPYPYPIRQKCRAGDRDRVLDYPILILSVPTSNLQEQPNVNDRISSTIILR
jgi:hypothetical protein